MLSGHAHGGQWRVPYLVNGVFAPNQGFLPKYAGGLYEVENSYFIVSRVWPKNLHEYQDSLIAQKLSL